MVPKKSLFALAKALEGIPILGALSGSPAQRAGLRYGDILLSVNGRRTHDVVDYVEAKAIRTDGMSVVYFRDGEERSEELAYRGAAVPADAASILAELIALRIGKIGDDGEGSAGQA